MTLFKFEYDEKYIRKWFQNKPITEKNKRDFIDYALTLYNYGFDGAKKGKRLFLGNPDGTGIENLIFPPFEEILQEQHKKP